MPQAKQRSRQSTRVLPCWLHQVIFGQEFLAHGGADVVPGESFIDWALAVGVEARDRGPRRRRPAARRRI